MFSRLSGCGEFLKRSAQKPINCDGWKSSSLQRHNQKILQMSSGSEEERRQSRSLIITENNCRESLEITLQWFIVILCVCSLEPWNRYDIDHSHKRDSKTKSFFCISIDKTLKRFVVEQKCWGRKYGWWPNTEAYYCRSQWEGSVSKPLYEPLRKHTHKSTTPPMPRFLTPHSRLWVDFPPFLSSAFLLSFFQPEPVKRSRFDMPSLNPSLASWAAGRSWYKPSRKGNFPRLQKIPHWTERQSLGIRKGRRKRGNSSGERGINLMASQ